MARHQVIRSAADQILTPAKADGQTVTQPLQTCAVNTYSGQTERTMTRHNDEQKQAKVLLTKDD